MAGKSDAERVNEMYWDTEASIAEIANDLGISRRALYEMVEPLPSGVECESCGAELYYANRSARDGETAKCVVCGFEKVVTAEDAEPYNEQADSTARIAAYIVGAAAAGIVITLLLRRRRR